MGKSLEDREEHTMRPWLIALAILSIHASVLALDLDEAPAATTAARA